VIVPIWRKEPEREAVAALAGEVERALRAAGVRVKADWREERPGFKYSDWELRGVPLRIEIGPRDAASGQVVLVPRTNRAAKEAVSKDGVARRVQDLLAQVQQILYDQALAFRLARTREAKTADEFRTLLTDPAGPYFVQGWWCGDAACEAAIKAETQATIRNLPLEQPERPTGGESQGSARCVCCGRPGAAWAVFAKAY
jgi:prolyl-tRNA synthetase